MATFNCDDCDTLVDVGDSEPSIVLCATCNAGSATWNCVLSGGYGLCDCKVCGPLPDPTEGPEWGIDPGPEVGFGFYPFEWAMDVEIERGIDLYLEECFFGKPL